MHTIYYVVTHPSGGFLSTPLQRGPSLYSQHLADAHVFYTKCGAEYTRRQLADDATKVMRVIPTLEEA